MTGKAGEYAVAAQLILRGVEIYFPCTDFGVDILTDSGCRIQVKTSHLVCTPKMIEKRGEGQYSYPLRRMRRLPVSDNKSKMVPLAPLSAICDFLVLWGIDQNRFWIVPSKVADKTQVLILGAPQPRKFVGSMEDVRQMVKLGYTHQQIANHYNVCRESITVFLNRKDFEGREPDGTMLARQCENAWESIVDFNRSETPQIVPVNDTIPTPEQET